MSWSQFCDLGTAFTSLGLDLLVSKRSKLISDGHVSQSRVKNTFYFRTQNRYHMYILFNLIIICILNKCSEIFFTIVLPLLLAVLPDFFVSLSL